MKKYEEAHGIEEINKLAKKGYVVVAALPFMAGKGKRFVALMEKEHSAFPRIPEVREPE